MRRSTIVRRGLVLASLSVLLAAPSAVAGGTSTTANAVERPTVSLVKRGLTKFWDTDQENSVDRITLRFRSVKLLPTRRAVPGRDIVESDWVTPVAAVFDQRTVRTSTDVLNGGTIRSCFLYRVSFNGIFYRGDFGWTFKNRDTRTKRLSSTYRC
jgi:hypothetical protein